MAEFRSQLAPAAATPAVSEPISGELPAHPTPASGGLRRRRGAISVVVVDDHAAVRLGLTAAISSRPGLVCVGALPDAELMPSLLYRTHPDVVVLDYQLPHVNGLELCRQIKGNALAPAVVLYSAYADQALTIPAIVAGVDGMVHKGASAIELLTAIETVAQGGKLVPSPVPESALAAAEAVGPADRRMLELLLRDTPRPDIAAQLNLTMPEVGDRTRRILGKLARS